MKISKLVLAGCLAVLVVHEGASAVRETAAAGLWTSTATWVGSTVPQAGDDVVATHAVTLDTSTPSLNSFSNTAAVTFSGWETALTATNVFINGTLTHPVQSAMATNASGVWVADHRVWIVCSNLTVAAGKLIDVKGKGWQGATNLTHGRGPGGGLNNGIRGNGASYGGQGGVGDMGSILLPGAV